MLNSAKLIPAVHRNALFRKNKVAPDPSPGSATGCNGQLVGFSMVTCLLSVATKPFICAQIQKDELMN